MILESRTALIIKLKSLQAARNFHLITARESLIETERVKALLQIQKLNFEIKVVHNKLYRS